MSATSIARTAPFLLLFLAACGQKKGPDIAPEPSVPAQAPVAPEAVAGQPPPAADESPQKQSPGVVELKSAHDVPATVTRFQKIITDKGLKVLAVVDHGANAKGVDAELRPTVLILFGNPKAGTQLMQLQQRAGLDLPMKALVYENEDGQVMLAYNQPSYVAERHGIEEKAELVAKMEQAVGGLTKAAAAE